MVMAGCGSSFYPRPAGPNGKHKLPPPVLIYSSEQQIMSQTKESELNRDLIDNVEYFDPNTIDPKDEQRIVLTREDLENKSEQHGRHMSRKGNHPSAKAGRPGAPNPGRAEANGKRGQQPTGRSQRSQQARQVSQAGSRNRFQQ